MSNSLVSFRAPQAKQFLGLSPFLRMSLLQQDLSRVAEEIFLLMASDPENPELLMNAAIVMQIFGREDLGIEAQNSALAQQSIYFIPAVRQPAKIKLLVLETPGNISENTPIECLLEGWDIDLIFYFVEDKAIDWQALPHFDAVYIGICDSVENQRVLQQLSKQLKSCPKPVFNWPQSIHNTERVRASQLLQNIPGLYMPLTREINRATLEQIAAKQKTLNEVFDWATYPVILRPIDSHGGKQLERCEDVCAVADYLRRVEGEQFYLSNFIDYADSSGLYTKIRIVLIQGEPYVCHLAITTDWKIHYLNAEMEGSEEKRGMELDFMQNFDRFVEKHRMAFNGIAQKIGLDYIGIDCAELPSGELLVFEVDHAMIVHGMDNEAIFGYKPPFIQKIPAAFRQMLLQRIG